MTRRLLPDLLRRRPEFRRFWTGQTISLFGDQISLLAIPLLAVLALDAGAAQMGLLTAVGLAPNLLLSLHAGAWADRQPNRRRLMLAADLGRAALLATIPVAYVLGALTLAQLYVVAFGVGCLTVLFYVSYNTLFVALVDREEYVEATSLLNGSRALSLVAGQGVAGALVAAFTAPLALLADAVSFLGSALFLGRVRAPEPPPATAESAGSAEGLRFISRTPVCAPPSAPPPRSISSTSPSGRSSCSTRRASSASAPWSSVSCSQSAPSAGCLARWRHRASPRGSASAERS